MNRTGLAAESMLPAMVLLVCVAAGLLLDLSARWRVATVILLLCEFALTRGLHTLLLLLGIAGASSDPNLALKVDNGIQFIADMVTWERGVAALAALLIWLAITIWLVTFVRTTGREAVQEHGVQEHG